MNQIRTPHETPEADAIAFADESPVEIAPNGGHGADRTWKILIVDDDQDVHDVSRYVLEGQRLAGRQLELIEARNLKEAHDQLLVHDDVAVILLDVVMEEHDSGLRFARWVREAGLYDVRIILRTGQPGYAPELDVIRDYDINDYRSKAELTRTRLITSVTTALRSFQQLQVAERTARGLEAIIASCGQLYQERDIVRLAELALKHGARLSGARGEGLVGVADDPCHPNQLRIIAGIGPSAGYVGRSHAELPNDHLFKAAILGADTAVNVTDGVLTLCADAASGARFVLAFGIDQSPDYLDLALMRLFSANLAAAFELARARGDS